MFGVYLYGFFMLRAIYSVLIGGEVETPQLTEDLIIYEILTWLPAHKVYELRCISKSWRKIIESSLFVETHIQKAKPVLLVNQFIKMSTPPCFKTKLVRKIKYNNIMVRNFAPCDARIYNSCNGLILCGYDDLYELHPILVNPATKKVLNLPHTTKTENMFCQLLGITYIASTKKYQVIHIINYRGINKFGIELLTVGENKWRFVYQSRATKFTQYDVQEIKFIENVAYWVIYERCVDTETVRPCVASFDILAEKFRMVHYPVYGHVKKFLDINGSFGFITKVQDCFNQFDIWVLVDFDKGKWIKQQNFVVEGISDRVFPVTTLENGRIIIFKGAIPLGYYAYDVQGMHTTYLDIGSTEAEARLERCRAHKDSLISLSF